MAMKKLLHNGPRLSNSERIAPHPEDAMNYATLLFLDLLRLGTYGLCALRIGTAVIWWRRRRALLSICAIAPRYEVLAELLIVLERRCWFSGVQSNFHIFRINAIGIEVTAIIRDLALSGTFQ